MRPCLKNHFQCLTGPGPGPTLVLAASGATALVSAVVSLTSHVHTGRSLAIASRAAPCVSSPPQLPCREPDAYPSLGSGGVCKSYMGMTFEKKLYCL